MFLNCICIQSFTFHLNEAEKGGGGLFLTGVCVPIFLACFVLFFCFFCKLTMLAFSYIGHISSTRATISGATIGENKAVLGGGIFLDGADS